MTSIPENSAEALGNLDNETSIKLAQLSRVAAYGNEHNRSQVSTVAVKEIAAYSEQLAELRKVECRGVQDKMLAARILTKIRHLEEMIANLAKSEFEIVKTTDPKSLQEREVAIANEALPGQEATEKVAKSALGKIGEFFASAAKLFEKFMKKIAGIRRQEVKLNLRQRLGNDVADWGSNMAKGVTHPGFLDWVMKPFVSNSWARSILGGVVPYVVDMELFSMSVLNNVKPIFDHVSVQELASTNKNIVLDFLREIRLAEAAIGDTEEMSDKEEVAALMRAMARKFESEGDEDIYYILHEGVMVPENIDEDILIQSIAGYMARKVQTEGLDILFPNGADDMPTIAFREKLFAKIKEKAGEKVTEKITDALSCKNKAEKVAKATQSFLDIMLELTQAPGEEPYSGERSKKAPPIHMQIRRIAPYWGLSEKEVQSLVKYAEIPEILYPLMLRLFDANLAKIKEFQDKPSTRYMSVPGAGSDVELEGIFANIDRNSETRLRDKLAAEGVTSTEVVEKVTGMKKATLGVLQTWANAKKGEYEADLAGGTYKAKQKMSAGVKTLAATLTEAAYEKATQLDEEVGSGGNAIKTLIVRSEEQGFLSLRKEIEYQVADALAGTEGLMKKLDPREMVIAQGNAINFFLNTFMAAEASLSKEERTLSEEEKELRIARKMIANSDHLDDEALAKGLDSYLLGSLKKASTKLLNAAMSDEGNAKGAKDFITEVAEIVIDGKNGHNIIRHLTDPVNLDRMVLMALGADVNDEFLAKCETEKEKKEILVSQLRIHLKKKIQEKMGWKANFVPDFQIEAMVENGIKLLHSPASKILVANLIEITLGMLAEAENRQGPKKATCSGEFPVDLPRNIVALLNPGILSAPGADKALAWVGGSWLPGALDEKVTEHCNTGDWVDVLAKKMNTKVLESRGKIEKSPEKIYKEKVEQAIKHNQELATHRELSQTEMALIAFEKAERTMPGTHELMIKDKGVLVCQPKSRFTRDSKLSEVARRALTLVKSCFKQGRIAEGIKYYNLSLQATALGKDKIQRNLAEYRLVYGMVKKAELGEFSARSIAVA